MVRALLGALLLALCIVGPARAQTPPQPIAPCYPGHFLSAANLNQTQLAIGPHSLCGAVVITNTGSTTGGDVRFYDTGAITTQQCSGTSGTQPVVWNIPVPVNSTAANVAGIVVPLPSDLFFQRGIGVCLTGAVTDTDNTNFVTGAQVNYGVR